MDYYESLGLNNQLQAESSPINRAGKVSAYDFDALYEVQGRRIKASQINVQNLFRTSDTVYGTIDFTLGSAFTADFALSNRSPNTLKPSFGIPYVSLYLGTIDVNFPSTIQRFYPQNSGSIPYTRFKVQADHDWQSYNQYNSQYTLLVVDTTGTSSDIVTIVGRWSYIDYVSQKGDVG